MRPHLSSLTSSDLANAKTNQSPFAELHTPFSLSFQLQSHVVLISPHQFFNAMLLPLLEPPELFLLLNFFVLFSVLQFLFFRTTERFVHMSYVFVISLP